jgi:hypothetical protein
MCPGGDDRVPQRAGAGGGGEHPQRDRTYLNIDGYLYGVVSLKELPDATFPGMLQNFSTLGFPIVVSGQVVIPTR